MTELQKFDILPTPKAVKMTNFLIEFSIICSYQFLCKFSCFQISTTFFGAVKRKTQALKRKSQALKTQAVMTEALSSLRVLKIACFLLFHSSWVACSQQLRWTTLHCSHGAPTFVPTTFKPQQTYSVVQWVADITALRPYTLLGTNSMQSMTSCTIGNGLSNLRPYPVP